MQRRTRADHRAILGTVGLAVAFGASACGGGGHGRYPDASPQFDAQGGGGSTVDAGTRPPPAVGNDVTALASGPAFLVGSGTDSCTNQDPPSGDRWCAFTLPSSFPGGDDLWVINVTQAMAGKPIKCDVSDLNCLLLSSTLYTGDLTVHAFTGDTLVFYADTGSSVGSAYAWRPGMLAARLLTTRAPLGQCAAHPKNDTVRCLQNPDNTTVTGQTLVDLSADHLSPIVTTPLPKVATFIVSLTSDPVSTAQSTQPAKFRTGLSGDGEWVAWSARPAPDGVETLNVQKIGDASTRVVVAADVSRWSFSRDGASLYWLKSFNYSPTAPLGTLQRTAFPVPPAGTAPVVTTVQPNVSFFAPVGPNGLLVLGAQTGGAGALSLLGDSTQPSQAKVLDGAVTQLASASLDGREVSYSRSGLDLYVNGLDLASACTLTAGAGDSPFGTFSDPPTTAFWFDPDAQTGIFVGKYTNLASCQTKTFASDLWVWEVVKDQGVVFGDDVFFDQVGNVDVTLRYAQMTDGALPASGTAIQQRANPIFSVMLPYLSAVVYTINAGGGTDGIYLRGGLPFPATTPPPPPPPRDAAVDAGVGGAADASPDGANDSAQGG
jgi:hypothetical protein